MTTFALCVVYLALIYVRPGEIAPALASLRLPAVTLVAASVSAVVSLFMQPRRFAHLAADFCFFGFCLASVASNLANGHFAAGYDTFVELLPLVGFYVLIRVAVQTGRQMRWFIAALVILSLFQAVNGIVQYRTGTGIGGATAVIDGYTQPESLLGGGSEPQPIRRIRGTGIFGDPNDLAMSFVIVMPFLLTAVLATSGGIARWLAAFATLGTISYALYLTQSRGGLVGLAAMGAAYAYRRFGRVTALVAAVIVVVAIVAAPGRLRVLTSAEESAQGRIQAWAAGIEMLKSKPVLGVGFGEFTTWHERVAHNSFVHVFAETGFVGIFFFVGTFYWFFVGNGPLRNVAGAAASPMARDLWASCIGAVVCACFLSRQYVPVLYIPLALGAVRVGVEQAGDTGLTFQRWWDWCVVAFLTVAVVAVSYVAVRALVVWSV